MVRTKDRDLYCGLYCLQHCVPLTLIFYALRHFVENEIEQNAD